MLPCTRPDTLFTVSTWRHAPTHRARHLPKSTECRQSFLIVGRGIPDSPTPRCPCPCRSAERRAAGTIVDQILSPPGNRSLPFKRLCFRPIYPFDHRLFQSWRFLQIAADSVLSLAERKFRDTKWNFTFNRRLRTIYRSSGAIYFLNRERSSCNRGILFAQRFVARLRAIIFGNGPFHDFPRPKSNSVQVFLATD